MIRTFIGFTPNIDKSILNLKKLNLSWREIADDINDTYETQFTPKQLSHRHDYLIAHQYDDIVADCDIVLDKNAELCYNNDKEYSDELLELAKAKIKLADERTQNTALVRQMARIETLQEIANNVANIIGQSKPFLSKDYSDRTHNSACVFTVVISDWHYGYCSDSHWNIYNTNVATKRVNTLRNEVIRYIQEYEPVKINVVNLGDLISGRIHSQIRINNRIDVITQIEEVSEIVAEFLDDLADYVPVDYYATSDNHSRIEPNMKENLSAETLTRITHWYLKHRFDDKSLGVTIHDNDFGDDITNFNIFNFNVAGVHGDKDKSSKVVSNLTLMTDTKYDLILTAHMHHFSGEEQNRTLVLSNGSLMGTDDYAVDLRCSSHPTQNLIVSTRDNVCKALHIINLE